ncbi:MAG TPA: SGNH/GDSL hydrolase family protein [Kofleriaceae bacterium]|nr:SGNH/GDSL hydrolase family protein [Kofleriaceae bacterium]
MAEPAVAVPTPITSPHRSRLRRWAARFAMLVAGLAVGLAIAELVFRWRDHGAFPHLNVYVADPELGVRLAPGAEEKISFGGNPVTSVRINSDGFRGPELPPPGGDEVLVVGDSQVFGLGVEEDQTFAHLLSTRLGRPVVNAGVPTYGPPEYRAVIAEQLAKRHPKTVVLAINLVNDLFEAEHPNKLRHAVWDGWAVRKELAPASTTWFPGRDFVYRRSHLFFALRKWWHESDALEEKGVASEGTWRDVIAAGTQASKQHASAVDAPKARAEQLAALQKQLASNDDALDNAVIEVLNLDAGFEGEGNEPSYQYYVDTGIAKANPGDIVSDGTGEGERTLVVTADQIARVAAARAQLRAKLAKWAKDHKTKKAAAVAATIDQQEQLREQLGTLDAQKVEVMLEPPLGRYVRDVDKLVRGAGARLVVLILPIDVQVSADEWKKYGAKPRDMEPSKALQAELAELCRSIGVTALDATPVLAAAEPGAFLDKDIHMTPKGHAAVAAALARAIAAPPPAQPLASDRSPVPVPAVWKQAPEVIVAGSTAANCETKQVREWLRVQCTRTDGNWPSKIVVEQDDGHEALTIAMPQEVSALIPIVPGRQFVATISWQDVTRVLRVGWANGKPVMAFDKPQPIKGAKHPDDYAGHDTLMTFASPVERAICDCWNVTYGGERYNDAEKHEVFTCSGVYGAADPACTAAFVKPQCGPLLACIRRDASAYPPPKATP